MRNKNLHLLLWGAAFLLAASHPTPAAGQERRVGRTERRADRNFVRQRFDKAMSQYESAVRNERDADFRASIHLKAARLYFMVRDYGPAASHYSAARELRPDFLGVSDICEYVDALRFCGRDREAEAVCLDNAYRDIYSRYQRYQNTLEALSMRHDMAGDPGFSAVRLSLNTGRSEYWTGRYGERPVYAVSYSDFNDPGKLFFHRTHYYELDTACTPGGSGEAPRYRDFFRGIPVDLQNGPMTFSDDMKTLVTTVVKYDNKSRTTVAMADRTPPFRTKLVCSALRDNGRMYSRRTPLFPQEADASYAHPYFVDGGESLLFTSDMPGGFGGFDLYIARRDDAGGWGLPVNLGPEVNTEGDEIFPVFFGGRLFFSSNGLPGFGGYDLFSVPFDGRGRVSGSADHFPHPVNSVFNDYYICPADTCTAYFVSDRSLSDRDDLYCLRTVGETGEHRGGPFFGLGEDDALLGGNLLLNGSSEEVRPDTVQLRHSAPEGLLLTLYFDFDSDELTAESVRLLDAFAEELGDCDFSGLKFDGFADETGSDAYNYILSRRRADRVAGYLRSRSVDLSFSIRAHGRIKLSPEEIRTELGYGPYPGAEAIDWRHVNRRARKVEIHNLSRK